MRRYRLSRQKSEKRGRAIAAGGAPDHRLHGWTAYLDKILGRPKALTLPFGRTQMRSMASAVESMCAVSCEVICENANFRIQRLRT